MAGGIRSFRLTTVLLCTVLLTACGIPYGVYHTVQKGQTLYNIARVYHVPMNDIEHANDISDTTDLKPGEKLFIPGAQKELYVPPTADNSGVQRERGRPAGTDNAGESGGAYKKSASFAHPRSRGGTVSFIWPLHGSILQTFDTSGGQNHDGIDIKAREGACICAAADGKVIYSGDTIKGYGNMIIIKHGDGFVTVYAHNSVNMVRKGQAVRQGQVIAKVGSTGYTTAPHLHFELRLHAIPVNPLKYLPR